MTKANLSLNCYEKSQNSGGGGSLALAGARGQNHCSLLWIHTMFFLTYYSLSGLLSRLLHILFIFSLNDWQGFFCHFVKGP